MCVIKLVCLTFTRIIELNRYIISRNWKSTSMVLSWKLVSIFFIVNSMINLLNTFFRHLNNIITILEQYMYGDKTIPTSLCYHIFLLPIGTFMSK